MTGARSGSATTAAGPAVPSSTTLDPSAETWAKARGLSRPTLERLGVVSGTEFFPDLGRKQPALIFRYTWKGRATGWKARAYPDKSFVAGKGGKYSFWNIDPVLAAAPSTVFITEGEIDACSLAEAGIPVEQILSVPTGAREKRNDDGEIAGLAYVEAALREGLSSVSRFVWCGDNDRAGYVLRDDMRHMLGAARFHFVDWPDGCKDPNDVLRVEGPEALHDLVTKGALPWPIDGMYRLSGLPEEAPMDLWSLGFEGEFDHKLKIGQRELSIVTGYPGHGKTLLWANIWFNIVRRYDVPILIGSFETRPKPFMRRNLRSFLSGRPEIDMSEPDKMAADRWIEERYLFAQTTEQSPPLKWFLDIAEAAVIRHGVRIVQLDPWNRFEHSREDRESETEYVRRTLLELHAFAKDFNVHFQVIAHPRMGEGSKGAALAPSLRDVSGSAHWDNIPDQGFAVHRRAFWDEDGTMNTKSDLHHLKARFPETGYRSISKVRFDLRTCRFVSDETPAGAGHNAIPLRVVQ